MKGLHCICVLNDFLSSVLDQFLVFGVFCKEVHLGLDNWNEITKKSSNHIYMNNSDSKGNTS